MYSQTFFIGDYRSICIITCYIGFSLQNETGRIHNFVNFIHTCNVFGAISYLVITENRLLYQLVIN